MVHRRRPQEGENILFFRFIKFISNMLLSHNIRVRTRHLPWLRRCRHRRNSLAQWSWPILTQRAWPQRPAQQHIWRWYSYWLTFLIRQSRRPCPASDVGVGFRFKVFATLLFSKTLVLCESHLYSINISVILPRYFKVLDASASTPSPNKQKNL